MRSLASHSGLGWELASLDGLGCRLRIASPSGLGCRSSSPAVVGCGAHLRVVWDAVPRSPRRGLGCRCWCLRRGLGCRAQRLAVVWDAGSLSRSGQGCSAVSSRRKWSEMQCW
ncbi:hypothetical protein AVEN_190059-1 [Araneus ventricosus]|uniref:Uncharacterized protein n=1 Tax=Araneus ventricosus TaxID=182803 RepID=A0A4Y2MRH3_ARAVE|nr:hypothetical protein AVEN_190059-1 [Araneus ventricosus]